MSTTLATLLLVSELAAPASTPAAPPVTDDNLEAAEVDPDAPGAPPEEAVPPGPSAEPQPAPEGEPMEPEEADPWAETPPSEHSPPAAVAVERQAGDGLSQALKQPPPKKGYAKYKSPQRFGLELKFGPYLPNVDLNYNGPDEFGPYGKVFGRTDERGVANAAPKRGLMGAAAFEWQFLNPRGSGPLGLGYSISFFRDSAKALLAEPDPDADSVRSEADSTVFWTMPMALQLVYRFELLADRWNVPIVPYGKGGLAWALWWSKDGNGDVSRNSRGEKALGGVWGYQLNVGGMLQLDFLERGTSRSLDRTTGINHTYLFGEYQFSRIDNFGRKESMSLGDSTWFLGLAIEF